MARTRSKKIYRDIMARKGRTLLVFLSVLIGVFGVTTMVSITDLINRQLKQDLKPEEIAHTHVYVRSTGQQITAEQNRVYLDQLATLENVVAIEGQAVHPVSWQKAGAGQPAEFTDGFIVAFLEPFEDVNLEPVARVTHGRLPDAGVGEIAVEQRFADEHGIKIGDRLVFQNTSAAPKPVGEWEVVGCVLHPYWVFDATIQDQIPWKDAIYVHYQDAQQIGDFPGLTAIHLRYNTVQASEDGIDALSERISSLTPYLTVFTFFDNPDDNYIMSIISQISVVLNMLGIMAMVVSGFLVTNVMNTVVVEQKKQIGTMKSLGASGWDNFFIYAGIALIYGLLGTLPGILLAAPTAAYLAQELGAQAMTYIDGFNISLVGLGTGITLGLLIPVLAAVFPVMSGMRVSILEAITDLGISSSWGRSRLSRLIGSLPLPMSVIQALSNIYQKKGRLALTGLTLTIAVAAFMGVTAVDASLGGFVDSLYDSYGYEISITPQDVQDFDTIKTLLTDNIPGVIAVHPGYSTSLGIEGYESTNPLAAGTNQVTVTGIDPAADTIIFDLKEGSGWQKDPSRQGVIISRSLGDSLNKGIGDTVDLIIGGQSHHYAIIGIDGSAFGNLYIDWRELATITGYVDENGKPMPGMFFVDLKGQPSIKTVNRTITTITDLLRAHGIQATYVNQPQVADAHAQQVSMFGVIFNATSAIMAAVSAVGLAAALSMAVFERQKEIGVMRSIGAGSFTIMSQFLMEGVLVGILAWVAAAPLSLGLGASLMNVLPFDYLSFTYPPHVLIVGFVGVLIIAAGASLWPSLAASRKTVAEILRYQ
ncbi:MAG: ABC transporter permease [Anaerolineae bacterium]|nr:ABC transporter permease [Anaerolineae bacterium]